MRWRLGLDLAHIGFVRNIRTSHHLRVLPSGGVGANNACQHLQKFTYLVLFKTLDGICSGPSLTVGMGMLNDMWDPIRDRGGSVAAVIFVLTVIWATQMGPIFSLSLIETREDWQWVFHITSLLLIPCTLGSFLLQKRTHLKFNKISLRFCGAIEYRRITWSMISKAISRQLHMLIVETILFPTGFVLSIKQSVIFFILCRLCISFRECLKLHTLPSWIAFLPLAVGSLLAVPIALLSDRFCYQKTLQESIEQEKMDAQEKRLLSAMIIVSPCP